MGIPPYIFQCAHCQCGQRYPCCDVVVIVKTVVDEGSEIAKGPSEADISVCNMEVCCFQDRRLFGGWCEEKRKKWSKEGGNPPWFREEGSQPSQLVGYKKIPLITFLEILCNQTLAKISSGPAKFTGPRTQEHKRQPLCSQFFRFVSTCLHRA